MHLCKITSEKEKRTTVNSVSKRYLEEKALLTRYNCTNEVAEFFDTKCVEPVFLNIPIYSFKWITLQICNWRNNELDSPPRPTTVPRNPIANPWTQRCIPINPICAYCRTASVDPSTASHKSSLTYSSFVEPQFYCKCCSL